MSGQSFGYVITLSCFLHFNLQLEDSDPLESLHQCARRLVDRARMAAFVPDFPSPFANEARRYGINIAGQSSLTEYSSEKNLSSFFTQPD